MMKPRLLIISDMWGLSRCVWMEHYLKLLEPVFHIVLYDSRELANVPPAEDDADPIHSAFVQGGMDIAANKLLELGSGKVDVLGFSMGGTIAWKAGMKGLDMGRLYAVSSTRLRLQTAKPACKIQLFYGADDPSRPPASWFGQLGLGSPLIFTGKHDFYTGTPSATRICGAVRTDREIDKQAAGR